MPELPDITVYVERLAAKAQGQMLQRLKLLNAFVLRTAVPPVALLEGQPLLGVQRLGKRVVLAFPGELFVVVHLMIAGRLHWQEAGAKAPAAGPKAGTLALFEFSTGSLRLSEAGTQRRASIHLLQGAAALAAADPGGIEVLACTAQAFIARLRAENHTLKRSLTDPRLFSGIGNAYSDEILHRARLSPLALSKTLPEADAQRLLEACRAVLTEWTDALRADADASGWPVKVTAFHAAMAVHGRYKLPCPVCGSKVQRIVHASNETNYCARCQTGGRLLADRALSQLLKASWPKHIDDIE